MEVVHAGDGNGDGAALFVQRQSEVQLRAREHVVEVIDIDLDRLAGGERRAGFELAGICPAGEIAEQGQAKFGARNGNSPLAAWQRSEIHLVGHFNPSRHEWQTRSVK